MSGQGLASTSGERQSRHRTRVTMVSGVLSFSSGTGSTGASGTMRLVRRFNRRQGGRCKHHGGQRQQRRRWLDHRGVGPKHGAHGRCCGRGERAGHREHEWCDHDRIVQRGLQGRKRFACLALGLPPGTSGSISIGVGASTGGKAGFMSISVGQEAVAQEAF